MTGNNLVGTIPPSLYNSSSLEQVYLDNNQLIGRLSLNLGSIMPRLEILSLSQNQIQGNKLHIPAKLEYLDLSCNKFWGKLPSLSNGSSLLFLDLSNNNFVGSLHNTVCSNDLNKTKYLNFRNNHLSGVIPECWEKYPHLGFLDLQNNSLSGEIPRTLGSISSLLLLSAHENEISGRLPSSLMNLSRLKVLQLGRNKLVGSVPSWIGMKLTMLKLLNLRFNNFHGNIPHQLCYLSHIQIIDLAHNSLSGNIPRCFNNFSVLSGIETNSKVKISIFESVGDILVIKGREDTYRAFLGLVMLLDLSSNNFSGHIPSELMTLKELKSLNLSRNQLTGKIPNNIGDMKALESFDLSLNKLSGELPMSLSKLNFISTFNVSYNNLIGRVPKSTQVQSFNQSSFFGNKLCGPPLTNGCASDEVPPHDTVGDQKEDDRPHEADWGLIISIVLGFVSGFWIIVASLIVSRSWRIAYFRLLNKVIKI